MPNLVALEASVVRSGGEGTESTLPEEAQDRRSVRHKSYIDQY